MAIFFAIKVSCAGMRIPGDFLHFFIALILAYMFVELFELEWFAF